MSVRKSREKGLIMIGAEKVSRSLGEMRDELIECYRERVEFEQEFAPMLTRYAALQEQEKFAKDDLAEVMKERDEREADTPDFRVRLMRSSQPDYLATRDELIQCGLITLEDWDNALIKRERKAWVRLDVKAES